MDVFYKSARYFRVFSFLGIITFVGLICLYSDTTAPQVSLGERYYEKKSVIGLNKSTAEEPVGAKENSSKPSTYLLNVKQSSAAARQPRKGSLFCWVLTSKKYFSSRVPAVNETWLKRCDHGEFFTTEPIGDDSIPFSTVFAGLSDSYDDLFYKSVRAIHYSYTHISKDFDWYFKADDDTYVIVEHLRKFLSEYDSKEPLYLGFIWHTILPKGYNSGGAGYVLSNAAMKIFAEELSNNRTLCPFDKSEDVGIARCLASKGIYPARTKNSKNQERFSYTTIQEAIRILPMANDLITFHWQKPEELRMLEHLLYQVDDPRLSKHSHIN